MKLVYKDMGHVLSFTDGYVNELVVENKKMFFDIVNSMSRQSEGLHGDCVLSIADTPVEFKKYADMTVQFAPFEVNRKSLLTKLYSALEKRAVLPENYMETQQLLGETEKYVLHLAEDLPFEISCQKIAIGPVIRALSPEIEEKDRSAIENIFAYMEFVRELDGEKLFVMVNMRSYFSDDEMETFTESVCLHGFCVLLLESTAYEKLKHTKRFIIDSDLCEI